MVKTKSTACIRSLDELLAEATQGNACSVLSSSKPVAEVASTSTLRRDISHSSNGSSRHSSLEGASTSSSSGEGPSTLRRSILKKRGRSSVGLIPEIVAKGAKFPGAPACSDPQDGADSQFPDLKVIPTLKKTALEKKYLLPTGYTFIVPKADAIVNEPPAKCIAVYRATLNYGLRFPLHPVIENILTKHELAPA